MIQTIKRGYERYKKPTPRKWKILGDIILVMCAAASGAIMSLPISNDTASWINFALIMIMALGKCTTNLATESECEHPGNTIISPSPSGN